MNPTTLVSILFIVAVLAVPKVVGKSIPPQGRRQKFRVTLSEGDELTILPNGTSGTEFQLRLEDIATEVSVTDQYSFVPTPEVALDCECACEVSHNCRVTTSTTCNSCFNVQELAVCRGGKGVGRTCCSGQLTTSASDFLALFLGHSVTVLELTLLVFDRDETGDQVKV